MKVVGFKRSFGAHETVVCPHPGIVGSVAAAIFSSYENRAAVAWPLGSSTVILSFPTG